MTNWTDDQLLAIEKEGCNIIVSAGAGSGKTAVLTERVINKLRNGIDINHLLVLTFTNAAAAEMKDRIRKAIKKEGMNNQLDYIDSAYITTFDSYAGSIVRKYHYLLNISSNFNVIDNTVIEIEKRKIIDDIFESKYGNKKFDLFISSFAEKDDSQIKKMILSINDKLDLKSDKKTYISNYIDNYYNNEYVTNLLNEYEDLIINKKNDLESLLSDIKIYADSNFYEKLYSLLESLMNSNTYEEIRKNVIIDKYPISPKGSSDEFKDAYAKLKKEISIILDMCYYSLSELKDNFLSTKENIAVIIEIIKELDIKLETYKKENESFTFTDIAKLAIEIVKNNEEVRNEIKNDYNEIMVDEYQDTNDLQEEFISLISNNNVYMVGDIKQSIYKFRNANPEIFRTKYNNYSNNNGGFKIDLLKNFRSRDEVLNNINEIFDSVMDEEIGNADYKKSHRMVFGNKMYDKKHLNTNYNMDILNYSKSDEFKEFSNDEIEAFIIANDIKDKVKSGLQIIDKDTKELRNVNYGDFCIIMDRGSAFETYSKVFEYLSIPVIVWNDEKLNKEEDISVLKNIISFIIKVKENNIDQEFKYYFTSIARSYLFNFDDQTIFNIFKNNTFKDTIIYEKAFNIACQLDSLSNELLFEKVINEFDFYKKCILKGNIDSSFIRYDMFYNVFKSLSNLGYTPYELPLYFKNSSNIDVKYSLNTKVDNSVNIMNIHKSKGLEYPICYFSGFAKKFNNEDIKDSFIYSDKYGIIIPFYNNGIGNTMIKDLYKENYLKEDISEKIRLFYVATTRAKEKMIVVAPLDAKEVDSSILVSKSIRSKYNSFLSIMNSLNKKLNKYIKNIDINNINITKEYELIKDEYDLACIEKNNHKIILNEIEIKNDVKSESHFSKTSNKLYSKDEKNNLDYGSYMHYLFEITDFNNPKINNKKVLNFINKINLNDAKIYKELEFIYDDNNEIKHGIIDLLLEYNDYIDIIDYKLKNTVDHNYVKQILGYKKYIEEKTGKKVNTYLYSIMNEEFLNIK